MHNENTIIPLYALLAFADPQAAIGALFGVCFFLALKYDGEWWQLVLHTIASAGIGYSAAVSSYGSGKTMMVAALTSALSVTVLVSLKKVIKERLMDLVQLLINRRP